MSRTKNNVSTPIAVIQVKSGIGDVIWHLPFVRAIAAASPGSQVTFLAPPSSGAQELLTAETCVAETIYFDHGGSELRRGINLLRLAALLRRGDFRTVWILDRTLRPAVAAWLGGVPERIGLGLGAQQLFITNPGIDRSHFHDHPIDWLRALMAARNVPMRSSEPHLPVRSDILAAIREKYSACRHPWIVLGIGASDPDRDWPDSYWMEFLGAVRGQTSGTVFLIGGGKNIDRSQNLIAHGIGALPINACDLNLAEAAALLSNANVFVGPDSGPMNLAAAVGTPSFGFFGVNSVLSYSRFIHPIVPEGGPSRGGMARIMPGTVLDSIAPYLDLPKQ
jgi:heptosyltransferase II